MSKKIAWVTDSTASFSDKDQEWLQENHIYVVPLSFLFGEEIYKEGIDMSTEDFYRKMSQSQVSPTSSQPALGDFIDLYTMLKEKYDEAIVIHASSYLSGTFSTSTQAASIVDFPVYPIDSWIGSYPLKFLIEEGIGMYKKGLNSTEIVKEIKALREKCRLLLLPANLEQLRKSGRVSNFGSILGNLLQIKPVLAFKEGKISIVEKIRTMKKAEDSLIARLREAYQHGIYDRIGVIHAGEKEIVESILEKISSEFDSLKIEVLPLIPVAGVHTGVGTIGLAYALKE